MKRILLLLCILILCSGCRAEETERVPGTLPRALAAVHYEECYNGVGFFRTDKAALSARMPPGFVVGDGSMLDPSHEGYGLLVLIYISCPRTDGGADRVAWIATPIENPSIAADLRAVRWNWYEFGRLVDDTERLEELSRRGFSVQSATLSHVPFHEGDTQSSFEVDVPAGRLFEVRAALRDSVNFEAQSHRFWHRNSDGRLLSTRMDFEYHHSWIGEFESCAFDPRLLTAASLPGVECSGVGVTEAIESLTFYEQVVLWN